MHADNLHVLRSRHTSLRSGMHRYHHEPGGAGDKFTPPASCRAALIGTQRWTRTRVEHKWKVGLSGLEDVESRATVLRTFPSGAAALAIFPQQLTDYGMGYRVRMNSAFHLQATVAPSKASGSRPAM